MPSQAFSYLAKEAKVSILLKTNSRCVDVRECPGTWQGIMGLVKGIYMVRGILDTMYIYNKFCFTLDIIGFKIYLKDG